MIKIAPSLLSADFGNLRHDAKLVEPLSAFLHLDVMDGHFVPNLTIGPPVVNSLRNGLSRPFDIHLMVSHPVQLVPMFDVLPEDILTFHIESPDDPSHVIDAIQKTNAQVGISLKPSTPINDLLPYLNSVDLVLVMTVEPGFAGQSFMHASLSRIRALRQAIGDRDIAIAVDGGILTSNVASVVAAGADIVIAGSAIFNQNDPLQAISSMLEAASG